MRYVHYFVLTPCKKYPGLSSVAAEKNPCVRADCKCFIFYLIRPKKEYVGFRFWTSKSRLILNSRCTEKIRSNTQHSCMVYYFKCYNTLINVTIANNRQGPYNVVDMNSCFQNGRPSYISELHVFYLE